MSTFPCMFHASASSGLTVVARLQIQGFQVPAQVHEHPPPGAARLRQNPGGGQSPGHRNPGLRHCGQDARAPTRGYSTPGIPGVGRNRRIAGIESSMKMTQVAKGGCTTIPCPAQPGSGKLPGQTGRVLRNTCRPRTDQPPGDVVFHLFFHTLPCPVWIITIPIHRPDKNSLSRSCSVAVKPLLSGTIPLSL